jgi:SAM-dependent methyltransferase
LELSTSVKGIVKRHGGESFVAKARLGMSRRCWESRRDGLIASIPPGEYRQTPSTHYGDCLVDESWHYILHGFAVERLDFIIRTLGAREIQESSFADIGDSDGTFLRALGKNGTSINFSETVLANIPDLRKLQGCLPHIDLPDGSFDYVLLFETLEHLPDPVAGLREVERLARKGAFVSIPHVSKTRVKEYWSNRKAPAGESHVFEFSPRDFARIVSYTGFRISNSRRIRVFAPPRTVPELVYCAGSLLAEDWNVRCGIFKAFNVYYLERRRRPGNPTIAGALG